MDKILPIARACYAVLKVVFWVFVVIAVLYTGSQIGILNDKISELTDQAKDANERLAMSGYFPDMAEFLKEQNEKDKRAEALLKKIKSERNEE